MIPWWKLVFWLEILHFDAVNPDNRAVNAGGSTQPWGVSTMMLNLSRVVLVSMTMGYTNLYRAGFRVLSQFPDVEWGRNTLFCLEPDFGALSQVPETARMGCTNMYWTGFSWLHQVSDVEHGGGTPIFLEPDFRDYIKFQMWSRMHSGMVLLLNGGHVILFLRRKLIACFLEYAWIEDKD